MKQQTTSKQTKLSPAMRSVMELATSKPVHEYGNKTQLKSLAKRGLMRKEDSWWILTDAGISAVNGNKLAIELEYAEFFFRHQGFQIRHNIMMIDQRFNDGEYFLRHEFYTRSFNDEVNAVHSFQQRAIALARAEIRAGLA